MLWAAALLLLASLLAVGPARGGVVAPVNPAQPGVDQFPSRGRVNVTVTLPGQPAKTEDIEVSSQGQPDAVVQRGALQNGTIPTEIVAMRLQGQSPTLGPVIVSVGHEFGLPPSRGEVNNVRLDQAGHFEFGDSFFDVFFEIFAPQSPLGPLQARNAQPLRMSAEIFDLPPNRPQPTPPQAADIDHFKCYDVSRARVRTRSLTRRVRDLLRQGRVRSRKVQLEDQLENRGETVSRPVLLCNPVSKVHDRNRSPIRTSRTHLVCYRIDQATAGLKREALGLKNQFGATTVDLVSRDVLCLPSAKRVLRGKHRTVPRPTTRRPLSHFKCYTVRHRGAPLSFQVGLSDQFESRRDKLAGPTRVCNPVKKNRTPIRNPLAHMTCHPLATGALPARVVVVQNQFGIDFLTVRRRNSVCVPTHKTRCSEYAEQARVALQGPGGVPAGTVNSALHVPYQKDPESACP